MCGAMESVCNMLSMAATCGKAGGYNVHMRDGTEPCEACRRARAIAMQGWRKRRYLSRGRIMTDPNGMRRRLQALNALGYSAGWLSEHTGLHTITIAEIMRGRSKKAFFENAEKVARLYDEYQMTPAGNSPAEKRVRTYAQKKGYLPPLAWDDETIDDPMALPTGVNREKMERWLSRAAIPEEKENWKNQQAAESASA